MRYSAIAELAEGLHAFRNGLAPTAWLDPQPLTAALASIRERHRGDARAIDHGRIMAAVDDYLTSGEVWRREDVFDLCIGAAWLDANGKGILADRELREKLFALAETVTGRRNRLRTFRGLLHAYWSFPLHGDATPQTAIEGWKALRDWLKARHAAISSLPTRKPTWFNALAPYLHLLEENPCAPYAQALLRGNRDELQRAIDCLFIPTGSWLKAEAVMAPINEAALWQDEVFRERLPDLLKLATGEGGIQVTESVTRRAIAALVRRYARQQNYEPHEDLFMLALAKIGNPWRRQSAWDADVCDPGGNPCSLSREMVGGWLKDRLIAAFFRDGEQEGEVENALENSPENARSELWQRYSVFMQAVSVVSWWKKQTPALAVRLGEFLVIAPKNQEEPIVAYPWQIFVDEGATRRLGKDAIDGAELRMFLAKRRPAIRVGQTTLGAKFFEQVIAAKARMKSATGEV